MCTGAQYFYDVRKITYQCMIIAVIAHKIQNTTHLSEATEAYIGKRRMSYAKGDTLFT